MLESLRRREFTSRRSWPFISVAECQRGPIIVDYSVKPADTALLRRIFNKYASHEEEGQKYMTAKNLIRDYLGMQRIEEYNETTLELLAGVVDQTKDGLISFSEFVAFEALLRDPDSHHKLIFQLFDLDGKGSVSYDEFRNVIQKTTFYNKIPFNFDSEFISSYFGNDKTRKVPFQEFSPLLQDLEKEYQRQAFFSSKMVEGEITAKQFSDIMKTLRGHLLTPYVRAYLLSVAGGEAKHLVSFGYYRAFNSMLDNIRTLHGMTMKVAKGNRYKEIKKEELLHEARTHQEITPLQVDILYHLCDMDRRGYVYSTFHACQLFPKLLSSLLQEPDENDKEMSYLMRTAQQAYRFSLGSVAGATGATAVYPIDLVKTRMQNQRAVLEAEKVYKNSIDCFFKVVRNEGPIGLYRGLLPQLLGVSPEKAIKLTTNDFVRGIFSDDDGFISLPYEIVAGGCGGAAQVMFTNPLEIVKIRLQVAGETPGRQVTAWQCVKELGFGGLYRGARACFLRDIPFSAIYFPSYAHFKMYFADENGHNGALGLFGSAMLAGVPAAALVTPADVIKTRLQVKARQGQQTYRGVMDAFSKILKEEGGIALWKGSLARVLRSSPQFGVTLLTYELLQRLFNVDFGGHPTAEKSDLRPSNPDLSLNPDHIGGMRVAVATFAGIETKFGLCLPKFRTPQPMTLIPGEPPAKPSG
ncbi:predicted protein [Nematostella vectensis]|uniref:EF-hand domain-containing protein n=1 Tax=Nematostella vectensis TaxID=45351 RepID=A7S1I1_NEMVE|nr:predicted protein [Nematostella vectensis]|eukprot:XP_001634525.1 predicted protein [Nematostella vectensis]